MIIDCHTHYGICWADRDGDDPTEWLKIPDSYGVDKFILFGHYNLKRLDMCQADNDRLVQVAANAPVRYYLAGSAWPQMGKAGVEEARRCIEDLKMSALKFHPWVQGFYTGDKVFGEICELAGARGVPIIFHDGTPCYCLPEQIAGLARRFPRTTFVLGHAGLLWSWRSALEAARQPNIWLCFCGPTLRAIEEICRRVDPDRLLWGTDYGFGWADAVGYRLNLLLQADINDSLREKILGVNPLRLLGIAR
jgi:predicted TIM-barrel fold metal-dependent hydrolase